MHLLFDNPPNETIVIDKRIKEIVKNDVTECLTVDESVLGGT